MNYKLIVSIVPHNEGDFVSTKAREAGAKGASILMGKGTAANGVLQLLGLGDSSKDIVYIIVEESQKNQILNAVDLACSEKKAHFGVLFTLEADSLLHAGKLTAMETENSTGDAMNTHELINVIVNKGYAEDAMAAARKAGAGGGTIIGARGTAKEDDAAFFGMKIVPEKELLMILVPADKKDAIIQAITSLPCFAQAGSGIIFCNHANDFTLLGKKS